MRRVLIGMLTVLAVSTAAWGVVLPPPSDGKGCASKCGVKAGKNKAPACEQSCGEQPRRIRLHEAEVRIIAPDDDDCSKCTKDCPSAGNVGRCDKGCPMAAECGQDEGGAACVKMMRITQGDPREAECQIIINREEQRDCRCDGCDQGGPRMGKGKFDRDCSSCCEQGGKCDRQRDCARDGSCGQDCKADCPKMGKGQDGRDCCGHCEKKGKGDPRRDRRCGGDCRCGSYCRGDGCDQGGPRMGKSKSDRDCAARCQKADQCDRRRGGWCDRGRRGNDCCRDCPMMAKRQGGGGERAFGRDRDCCPGQRCGDGRSCRMPRACGGQDAGCRCGCRCGNDGGMKSRSGQCCDRPCGRDRDGGRMRHGGWDRYERPMIRHGGFGRFGGRGGWHCR